jgi:hypothetical protein
LLAINQEINRLTSLQIDDHPTRLAQCVGLIHADFCRRQEHPRALASLQIFTHYAPDRGFVQPNLLGQCTEGFEVRIPLHIAYQARSGAVLLIDVWQRELACFSASLAHEKSMADLY